MNLTFPTNKHNHRYYPIHADFIFKYASLANINFEFTNENFISFGVEDEPFTIVLDNYKIAFDYGDLKTVHNYQKELPIFKFHYSEKEHGDIPNVFPLGPSLVTPGDLPQYMYYFKLQNEENDISKLTNITCCQRPYGDATERRTNVIKFLTNNYPKEIVRTELRDQKDFWYNSLYSLINICVPGARIDILDRNQWELMGLGVCTISPRLDITLLKNINIVPGYHYIQCKDDFSDLSEIISWCQQNTTICKEIGNRVKFLFQETYTPSIFWSWIEEIATSFYRNR